MIKRSLLFVAAFILTIGMVNGCEEKSSKPKPSSSPTYLPSGGGSNDFTPQGSGSASNYGSGLGTQGFGSNGGIDIREVGSGGFGDVLFVQQGQTVTWQFQAFNNGGTSVSGTPQVVSITAQPFSPSMQISGSSVTFRPQNQNELSGQLIVTASTSGAGAFGGPSPTPDPFGGINSGGIYQPGINPGLSPGSSYGSSGYSSGPGNFTKTFRWQSGNGAGGGYGYGYGNNSSSNALPRILLGVMPQLLSGNANLGSIFTGVLSGLASSQSGGYGTYGGANFQGYGAQGSSFSGQQPYGGQPYSGQAQGTAAGSFNGQPYSGQAQGAATQGTFNNPAAGNNANGSPYNLLQ